jgi:CRISPR-associated protein Csm1
MILEAAGHRIRREFGLPAVSVLQAAGGRLLFLLPNLRGVEEKLENLRAEVDRWLVDRYFGELALNLAVGRAFSGEDLSLMQFGQVMEDLGAVVEEAKQQPLATVVERGVIRVSYPHGACRACGRRPAEVVEGQDAGTVRCRVCDEEARVGGVLPATQALGWSEGVKERDVAGVDFFGGIRLSLFESPPPSPTGYFSLMNLNCPEEDNAYGRRYLANYVPRVSREEIDTAKYKEVVEESEEVGEGAVKTFAQLAVDAVDEEGMGEQLLGVLKADVDRLGLIFSAGLGQRQSLTRVAALSRRVDSFFSMYLPWLLKKEFPSTYTVYAGGDDLLLIGPWRQTVGLAERLRLDFGKFCGGNPNVTLSAGLEFIKPHFPLNRGVEAAEERLERAKSQPKGTGRNQVCLLSSEPLPWKELARQREMASELSERMRKGKLSLGFVYRLLYFDEQRFLAEKERKLRAANWRARFAYSLARQAGRDEELREWVAKLMSLDRALHRLPTGEQVYSRRVAISLALYGNRKSRS